MNLTWKNIKRWLPIIGIALFVYILFKLDVGSIINVVANANINYLLIAILFVVLLFFPQTLKWWVIARKQKINVGFLEAFKINIIANYYGFITPSKLGAIVRAGYLKKYAGGFAKGVSNFVLDKVLDLSSLFFLAIVFSYIFRDKLQILNAGYLILLFGVLIFALFVLIKKERSKFFLGIVFRKFVPKKLKQKAKIAFDSFYEDMPSYGFLLGVFLINILTWIMIYLISYFIGLSLGINLSFIYFLAILPIATVVAQIPITISGLGTREATMIGLFGLFNIEPVLVFSMSMIAIILTNIIPAIIAIVWTLGER